MKNLNRNTIVKKTKKLLDSINKKIQNYDFNTTPIAIFGTGNTACLYQKCFEKENINPICFLDNDKSKQGTTFYKNIKVLPPNELLNICRGGGSFNLFTKYRYL